MLKRFLSLCLVVAVVAPAFAQEARRRWEMERQIRLDKFEQVLPRAMRDNRSEEHTSELQSQ